MERTTSNILRKIVLAFIILIGLIHFSCSKKTSIPKVAETALPVNTEIENEKAIIATSQSHENPRMRYKLLSSKYNDKSEVWEIARTQLGAFDESRYIALSDYIYERDIPTIQRNISNGYLNYEDLSKWYLFRILKYETDPATTLHAIISIMPDVVSEARKRDNSKTHDDHGVFGMPILLKDNINASGSPTTAGAIALENNMAADATIVSNLKEKGAIILGKANLSEWAYYFCDGCPLGYSAMGGQSLNPYGRTIFETGGSSAASGTSMAANYAAGAVGTETSGSILSPSSQNSIVGLKPTLGTLSRSGIVPISSTLDTPGPMTRNVIDNAILYSAMYGEDNDDESTLGIVRNDDLPVSKIQGDALRLGANTNYLERNELYRETVEKLKENGVEIIEFTPREINLEGFVSVLDYDMQRDLPDYISKNAGANLHVSSVKSVIEYNLQDSTMRAPYGQGRFISSRDNKTSNDEMKEIKERLEKETRAFLDEQLVVKDLDAILSINNYDASNAAMAKYPCLALPMGYTDTGEPQSMTLVGKRFDETKLYSIGSWFESKIFKRTAPKGY